MTTIENVKEARETARTVEKAYIDENTEFKVGDKVILYQNKIIGGEITETIVGQVEIHSINVEEFRSNQQNSLWIEFLRPTNHQKVAEQIDFDRMQLASEFLGQLEYDIPTAESVAQELEHNEDQEDEKD